MSLVAYGSSDESGESDEESGETQTSIPEPKIPISTTAQDVEKVESTSLFSVLPKPKTQMLLQDENSISRLLLNKRNENSSNQSKKESVKIAIPSLKDLEEEDLPKPLTKRINPAAKGSSLFSILPPPKNLSVKETKRTLVPHSVMKPKPKTETVSKPIAPIIKQNVSKEESDEDSGADDDSADFFKLSERINPNPDVSESSFEIPPFTPQVEVPSTSKPKEDSPEIIDDDYHVKTTEFMAFNNTDLELDDKALQILCGGKRKRQSVPLDIIDVSGAEIMPDASEWLVKQLTEEKKMKSNSHRKNDGPSNQSRRKHQITYLAYQAKEQELELQNQWANNKMSRKQTQSKYGF